MITLSREHVYEMCAHAREESPAECCGLIGGSLDGWAESIYRLRNVARDPLVAYEAAPEELFDVQRRMRVRGQQLLGIYHSHPRSSEPVPSAQDVRLAFYPSATYFIIGFKESEALLRAFSISERQMSWERVEYAVRDE
jgi:proteasome lid subunit RPN8/RPN11